MPYTPASQTLLPLVYLSIDARKILKSFTAQYRAFRLVYYEEYADVRAAIAREKQIKGWTRAKKNALVASMNPQWLT